ncbi:aspartate/glutamate racemase family protein [Haloferax sp. ATB1]|uniref:aspartate/glutamate racemase family protein n=1 Tax=Haloferax sp. ATB1 TaxID=1508454 RepID=UPI0005B1D759|nr:aspartate/glutamate racemase family protein [Haloferax sp. ATB1]
MNGDDAGGGERRTVGILGGMSSQSTVEYYRLIDEGINDARGGHHAAELLIRSVDFGTVERFIRTEQWDDAGEYLAGAATDLEAGGADFVVMATNTMHRVAPRIEAALSVPFVHIVDPAADAIHAKGLDAVGILGTRATMDGAFYRERFEARGIDVILPDRSRFDELDRIIFEELTKGEVRESSRAFYLEAIDSLVERGAESIVLGCTEIELLVEQTDRPGVPLFDTTALHAERAVERSLGQTDA